MPAALTVAGSTALARRDASGPESGLLLWGSRFGLKRSHNGSSGMCLTGAGPTMPLYRFPG
ncbi:hypothetical protein RHECNPAF_13300130 [Rhizobium etli CNPAF512]|nr:hypothetical protein RHECNPAF_13300130 [Rhizobium etli CNPAF512]